MPRKPRSVYLPLDVEFFDNDRILQVGEKAGWLYLAMCCRAKRLLTDGVLSVQQIDRLHIPGWKQRLASLVTAGLVIPTDDGRYLILGWLERNLSAEQVEQARARDRFRKDSGRNPGGIRSDPREGKRREDKEKSEVDVTTEGSGLRVIS